MFEFRRVLAFEEVNRINSKKFDKDAVSGLHGLVGELLTTGKFRDWGVRVEPPVCEKEALYIPLSGTLTTAQQKDLREEIGVGSYEQRNIVQIVDGFQTKVKRSYYVFHSSNLGMRHVVPWTLKLLLAFLGLCVLVLSVKLLTHNSKYVRM